MPTTRSQIQGFKELDKVLKALPLTPAAKRGGAVAGVTPPRPVTPGARRRRLALLRLA